MEGDKASPPLPDERTDPKKSEAWYKQRVRCVGTSEIAHLLELPYFTRYVDLLTRKVGLKPPIGEGIPTPCLWSQTFTTVTQAFLEKDMKVEIHGHKLFIISTKYPGSVTLRMATFSMVGMQSGSK